MLWGSVLGGYPRSGYVRHEMRDAERGDSAFLFHEAAIALASASVIGTQVASGMRYATDGMIDFHDIFRPFARSWRNVSIDGLIRYFDNNFFYRIPVFNGEPDPARFVWASRVKAFKSISSPIGMKVVIPGPLSFLLMGKNESGLKERELGYSIAKAISLEAKAAEKAGAAVMQIDEPILSDQEINDDLGDLEVELLSIISSSIRLPTILSIYFDVPRKEIYEKIINAKVDYISLDVADSPRRAMELINAKGFGDKRPVLGLIDARRIHDDNYDKIKDMARSVAKNHEEVGITTTTWFDTIPYSFAIRKTQLLGIYLERLGNDLKLEVINPITEVR
ncbi:MAG: methylcobalamin--homocysteine methyltransferase [Caldisphaeraceae archaeon]|nr:methylcobalamin--homocysteine methyltransferase [Caldisphaeraceae archaeon]